jgi:FKBP-type peptidyl-prolyl cis-trans isomerase 2
MKKIAEKGDTIRIHYTGWKADTKEQFDTTYGKDPFTFMLGNNEVIIGLDKAIVGMELGDEKTINVPKELAYGERLDGFFVTIPRGDFLGKVKLEVGKMLAVKSPYGQIIPAKIIEINSDSVKLDMNKPLAGFDLIFKVKLVEILKKGNI